jgi:hypothetical protein
MPFDADCRPVAGDRLDGGAEQSVPKGKEDAKVRVEVPRLPGMVEPMEAVVDEYLGEGPEVQPGGRMDEKFKQVAMIANGAAGKPN